VNQQQIPVLIFLIPFIFSLAIPFFSKNRKACQIITTIGIGGAALVSLIGFLAVKDGSVIHYYFGGWLPPFGIEWRLDTFSALMALLITVIAAIVIAATGNSVDQEMTKGKMPYYMVVLLHISGLLGIILTHDFFNLFVFLEVASLTGYALIASGDGFRGNVASFRYLLIGTVGASFYLLGVGYLYAVTGTLNMSDMALRLAPVMESRTVFLGLVLILLGLAIKMGLFPFHGWLPDAYTYASDSAAALIAPIMTKVAIYSLIRIFFLVLGDSFIKAFSLSDILMWLGAVAVVAGSLMAFLQKDFKRMLAYSSISHIGLIVLALGLDQQLAFVGAILHIINHAVMKAALFLIAAAAYYQHKIHNIFDFSKMRGQMPYTGAAFVLAALSMIGIPPLCGFFSKWYILIGALQAGQPLMAFVIVASSLLTALYFFKVMEHGFFQKQKEEAPISEAPLPFVISTGCLALSLFILGIFAPKIVSWGMQTMTIAGG